MKISRRAMACFGVAVMALAANLPALAQEREDERLRVAAEVLDELRSQKDQQIPERLLQRAYGVAVIPSVTKLAFFLGGLARAYATLGQTGTAIEHYQQALTIDREIGQETDTVNMRWFQFLFGLGLGF